MFEPFVAEINLLSFRDDVLRVGGSQPNELNMSSGPVTFASECSSPNHSISSAETESCRRSLSRSNK